MPSNKAAILEAASGLLHEAGISNLSVRAIAMRAGVSTIGIYSHFDGKQGILDQLYINGFTRVREAMLEASYVPDPQEAVMEGARRYLEVAREHEGEYRLIFGEANAPYDPSDDARQAGQQAFEQFVALVSRLGTGTQSKQQQQKAALQIWALIHGYVSLQQHAVRELVSIKDWTPMILDSVEKLIKAELQTL